MDATSAKARAEEAVATHRGPLLAASHRIHAHPELGYEEHLAHDTLCDLLEEAGLTVERHAHGLDTAFAARAGASGPLVAVVCEYDALPGLGHACGHNIIATAGAGAGIALAPLADALGGRLLVLGTPAEEGGGGKVRLLDAGAFTGVDAALMVHPADAELTAMSTLAVAQVEARYRGRAAHAAAFPWEGRNALDAAVLGYVNVAALRQHLAPGERVHGVFTDGGARPNIVPDSATTTWMVRSPDSRGLAVLRERVAACLHAGAAATGCEVELVWDPQVYREMLDNPALQELWRANAARTGRTPEDPTPETAVVGSTDMGNVSHVVPSIHPMIQVAEPGVPIHSTAFAAAAASPAGDQAVLDGAVALAGTVIDLWTSPDTRQRVRRAFAAVASA